MRRIAQSLGLLLVLSLAAARGLAADSEGPIRWRTDFPKAQREAQHANKLLVVNVHASWCAPCQKLQQTTLRDPSLAGLIQEKCVAVSIDGDRQPDLLQRWGVAGYPTQVILRSDGSLVGKIEGFVDAVEYRRVLTQKLAAIGKNEPSQVEKTAPFSPPGAAGPPPKAATSPVTPIAHTSACDPAVPLALKGYCPVTMITRAELVLGSADHCLVYRGRRYHFRSPAESQLFAKRPQAYLPAENGNCVVTLFERNEPKPGRVEYPALFADRVFLFSGEVERRKFLLDPEKYIDERGAVRRTAVGNRSEAPVR